MSMFLLFIPLILEIFLGCTRTEIVPCGTFWDDYAKKIIVPNRNDYERRGTSVTCPVSDATWPDMATAERARSFDRLRSLPAVPLRFLACHIQCGEIRARLKS